MAKKISWTTTATIIGLAYILLKNYWLFNVIMEFIGLGGMS